MTPRRSNISAAFYTYPAAHESKDSRHSSQIPIGGRYSSEAAAPTPCRKLLRVEVLASRPYTPKRSAELGYLVLPFPSFASKLRASTIVLMPAFLIRRTGHHRHRVDPCTPPFSLRGIAHHDLRIAPSSSGIFSLGSRHRGVPAAPLRRHSRPSLPRNLILDSPLALSPSSGLSDIRTPNPALSKPLKRLPAHPISGGAAVESSTPSNPYIGSKRMSPGTPTRRHCNR